MKTCRFCSHEIPFYGGDTCKACLEQVREDPNQRADRLFREKREEILTGKAGLQ